jgi:hypothetical protein
MIEKAYIDSPLQVPVQWNLSRKHFRLRTVEGRFVKLNKIENRINQRELKFYCYKFKPTNVYFSVLNWLFPERVGKKSKARYCVPLNGEYVVDIDSYLAPFPHIHRLNEWAVCERCLIMSRLLTLSIIEALEKHYCRFAVVFSGKSGFHVHVLDFDYRDFAKYKEADPLWCHHASRYKLTRLLQRQVQVFDRAHFNVSVDPMRVVTVPNSINGFTGLRCSYLGGKKDLEKLHVPQIVHQSKVFCKFHMYSKLQGYPEHGSRF